MWFWTRQELKSLRRLYGKQSYAAIAEALKRTYSAVRYKAAWLGLTCHSNLGRRYCADKEFFARPRVANCYWAGMLAADGCIARQGRVVALTLASKDGRHVEELKRAIRYTGPLHKRSGKVGLSVTCPEMAEDLRRNFNVTPQKSLTLKPPPLVSPRLAIAFIVGFIDGDGCICYRKYGKYLAPRIAIVGTRPVLSWIKRWFDTWAPGGARATSKVRPVRGQRLFMYTVTSGRAITIARKLLSINLPRLSRKWNRLTPFLDERGVAKRRKTG